MPFSRHHLIFWLGSLVLATGCSYPVDEFVTQRATRDDASPDAVDAADAADALAQDADAATAPDTATKPDTDASSTCVCVDCPGDSRKCKAYDPPGCGVFNDPC